jgi:predicted outer membrane protein
LAQLQSAPNGRAFDRTYINQQARSDARTLALYDAYARSGDNAQGRRFANEALPYIADEHAHSASLAVRAGG